MANSYPLNNYPFNRIIKSKNIDQSEETVTITGQLIVLPFVYPIEEESYDLFVDDSILNPQFLKPCYLLRYELEELSSKIFYYLKNSKKRSGKDILRGTQILREEIWDTWDYLITSEEDDDNPYDLTILLDILQGLKLKKSGLKILGLGVFFLILSWYWNLWKITGWSKKNGGWMCLGLTQNYTSC